MILKMKGQFKQHLTLALTVFLSINTCAQSPEIEITKDRRLAKVENNLVWLEPVLASHPSNPNLLIAASFTSDIDDRMIPTKTLGVFRSEDGGVTWSQKDLVCTFCSDPWVSITNDGTIFLTALGTHPNVSNNGDDQLLIFSSTDGGKSWSDTPQHYNGSHDAPRTTVAADGTVYLLSTYYALDEDKKARSAILIAKASPEETKFEVINTHIPSNLALNYETSTVLSDGSLFVSYFDYQRKADGGFRTRKGRLNARRVWAIKSNDQGKTFLAPKFVSEEASFKTSFFTSTQVEKFKDRLFVASMNKNLDEVVFAYSPDKGDEWIRTQVEVPSKDKRTRWFPHLAINGDGTLVVAWLDKRDGKGKTGASYYAPYMAVSKDGGETFSAPIRIASEVSHVNREVISPASRWELGGDYFGLTATSDGKFHVVWPDARTGKFELWYTTIDIN